MELKFRVRKTGAEPPVTVLDLEGGLLATDVTSLRDELDRLSSQSEPFIVINMERLDFIGSSGIGSIMFAADRLAKRNGRLLISGMNEEIRNVFSHLGLLEFVPTFDSEQDAVTSLRPNG